MPYPSIFVTLFGYLVAFLSARTVIRGAMCVFSVDIRF